MKKRILAIVVVALMLTLLIPATVMAEGCPPVEHVPVYMVTLDLGDYGEFFDTSRVKVLFGPEGAPVYVPPYTVNEAYNELGWDGTLVFDSCKTLTMQYAIKTYTVTFYDSQGDLIGAEVVDHGSDIVSTAGDFTYDTGERPVGDGFDPTEGQNITECKSIVVNTEYEVTYEIGAGTLDSGDLVQWIPYGGNTAVPVVTPETGYEFDTPPYTHDGMNIVESMTIFAVYVESSSSTIVGDLTDNPATGMSNTVNPFIIILFSLGAMLLITSLYIRKRTYN